MNDMAATLDVRIETERLILRPPSGGDFAAFCAFSARPENTEFIGGIMAPPVAWRAWCALAGSWLINGFGMFSVLRRDSGEWIGRVGPWQPEGWPGTEVGWGIAAAHGGQGFATEAAIASIDFAFDVLGWDDVMHIINPANLPSIGVARKLGSVNRGPTQMPAPFDGHRVDNWGQSAAIWRANRHKLG
jgi:RimJ/RimL family protein N-acetyltransferase